MLQGSNWQLHVDDGWLKEGAGSGVLSSWVGIGGLSEQWLAPSGLNIQHWAAVEYGFLDSI
jgi:hypothetical protein